MSFWTHVNPEALERQSDYNLFLSHLFTGFCFWDLAVHIPEDFGIIRRREAACRWGMLLFYMPTRYCGLASMIGTLIYVDMIPLKEDYHDVGAFFQVTFFISYGFAYCILVARVVCMWRHLATTGVLLVTLLASWGSIFYGLVRIIHDFGDRKSHIVIHALLGTLSTELLVLASIALIISRRRTLRRQEPEGVEVEVSLLRRYFNHARFCYDQGFHFYVAVFLVEIPIFILHVIAIDPSGLLRYTVAYVGLCVVVLSSSRVFKYIKPLSNGCPFEEYAVALNVFRSFACGHRMSEAEVRLTTNLHQRERTQGREGILPVRHPPLDIALTTFSRCPSKPLDSPSIDATTTYGSTASGSGTTSRIY